MTLGIEEFPDFFRAIWTRRGAGGHLEPLDPFEWQIRLLARVRSQGWPSTLDLPTGSGKTAALDVALFALALDAFTEPDKRRQPRRVVLVVDRRVVVDQAYKRAVRLAEALQRARDGVLARVAGALRELQKEPDALPVLPAILRGGMPRESEWARTPHQPVLLASTVDQVGSRLLFRGYGVTNGMRPVHAGLLGRDTLYLLDEVHLSRPFEETLHAVGNIYTRAERLDDAPTRPLRFVRMSATVAERASDTFELTDAERAEPVLARRLGASKRAVLREVKTPRDPDRARDALAKACVREAVRLGTDGAARVIAVIVNRVDTARRVAALAGEALPEEWDVRLMTGRMRPLDRTDLERALLDRIRAGRERTDDRVLLVSTQAVEAGADFDFDALITECASLDALRQRFGRLDRLGDLVTTDAVVLVGSSDVDDKASPDPIYGEAMRATWGWMMKNAERSAEIDGHVVDFGIDALGRRLAAMPPDDLIPLLAPRPAAPVLVGSHLDRWVQTSPIPSADPDVAAFLHGPERGAPDVHIVWRADVEPNAFTADDLEVLRGMLQAVPPSALEALSVPLWTARSWLSAVAARSSAGAARVAAVPAVADVEGGAEHSEQEPGAIAPALVWHGDETRLAIASHDIGPGDTLVVPSSYGGLAPEFDCWDPNAREHVPDRGDEAQLLHRARAVVRWNEAVLRGWGLPSEVAAGPTLPTGEDRDELDAEAERDAFDDWRDRVLAAEGTPAWAQCALQALGARSETVRLDAASGTWRATWQPRRVARDDLRRLANIPSLSEDDDATEATTEDDGGSFTGKAISLDRHLAGVEGFARRFAESLSLPERIASDLALAGRLHDLGKADPRFQLMLHGGDAVRHALADELLAKSAIPARDRAARARARAAARYPRGARHELMSVALVASSEAIMARAHDWDLVLHLVASHHGWCRPFAPPVVDREPVAVAAVLDGTSLSPRKLSGVGSLDVAATAALDDIALVAASDHALARIDSGVAERFWQLVRRYGWWGLAWLEAIVRLADHRESEEERRDA